MARANTDKAILEESLTPRVVKELWTTGYRAVLPVTPQDFSLRAVLPIVLYTMRWAERRGRGKFIDVFGKEATALDVAKKLAQSPSFRGVQDPVSQSILADLLLCYCLENKGHQEGRDKQIARVLQTHFFASWVDLPAQSAHLRLVPELLAVILADQPTGEFLGSGAPDSLLGVGQYFSKETSGVSHNLLLGLFGAGVKTDGASRSDRRLADSFDESTEIPLDQLLMVRIAQQLGEAPLPAKSQRSNETGRIVNQLPLATDAALVFRKDMTIFLRSYAKQIPRQTLVVLLESALVLGLTTTYLAALKPILMWEGTDYESQDNDGSMWPVFVDCSAGADMSVRRCAEASFDELLRMHDRVPVILMAMKIVDRTAKELRIRLPQSEPDPKKRISAMWQLLVENGTEAQDLRREIGKTLIRIAEALKEADRPEEAAMLEDDQRHPVWPVAETIARMMGDKLQGQHLRKYLESCLNMNSQSGLGRKDKLLIKGKWTDRRSVILQNSMLEFLVHRHLRKESRSQTIRKLSLGDFVDLLRQRYGFYVDEAPPGVSIGSETLRANRAYLENRLRELGLLRGVNDAESMKLLRPRFGEARHA